MATIFEITREHVAAHQHFSIRDIGRFAVFCPKTRVFYVRDYHKDAASIAASLNTH